VTDRNNSTRTVSVCRLNRLLDDGEMTFPAGQTVYLLGLVERPNGEDKVADKAFIVTTCAIDLAGVTVGWNVDVPLDAIEVKHNTTVDELRRNLQFDRDLADAIERSFSDFDDYNNR
jgi:hypothetical protein